jgi:hypothetical protein
VQSAGRRTQGLGRWFLDIGFGVLGKGFEGQGFRD